MLERLTRRTVLEFEPYEWEPSSAVIAERHGLQPRDVIRFDLNTSPFAPASWDAASGGRPPGTPTERVF